VLAHPWPVVVRATALWRFVTAVSIQYFCAAPNASQVVSCWAALAVMLSPQVKFGKNCWNANGNHCVHGIKVSSRSQLFPLKRSGYKLRLSNNLLSAFPNADTNMIAVRYITLQTYTYCVSNAQMSYFYLHFWITWQTTVSQWCWQTQAPLWASMSVSFLKHYYDFSITFNVSQIDLRYRPGWQCNHI